MKDKRSNKEIEMIQNVTDGIDLLALENLNIEYTIDEEGAFEKFENQELVMKYLDKMCKNAQRQILDTLKFKDEKAKMGTKKFLEVVLRPEKIFEDTFSIYLTYFHNFHGYQSGINDTLSYTETTEILNKKLVNDCYLFITNADTTTNEIRYVLEKYGQPESYNMVLRDFLSETFLQISPKAEISKIEYDVLFKTSSWVNMTTGWPTSLSFIKKVETIIPNEDSRTKIELWSLEAKSD
jgi:hypothetical protein